MAPALHDTLIAACRRAGPVPATPAAEWPAIVALATKLGVAGHLHEALSADPARAGMPAEEWARLQATYYAFAARNALLLSTLQEVLRRFAQHDIPVIVLKGAALVETVYANVAVRTMHDLDLLVPRERTAHAARLLEELGFLPDEWFKPQEWYLTNLHHIVPYRRGSITVEVHHRLLPLAIPETVPQALLWERARPATIAGVSTRVLAPTDLLLHLALHLALSHHFARTLAAMRDVAEVLYRYRNEIDWDALIAASSGVERSVHSALMASRELAGADVPEHALQTLRRAGRIGSVERAVLMASARRLALTIEDDSPVPTWVRLAWVAELLERRAWPARAWGLIRRIRSAATP